MSTARTASSATSSPEPSEPASATTTIVEALTRAIVEQRLRPGTKLAALVVALRRPQGRSWPIILACRARWCARRCSSCRKTG